MVKERIWDEGGGVWIVNEKRRNENSEREWKQ